jgi:hypothetical protein
MSSDGTSLEEIETGSIPNTADSSRMQAILRDMDASGAEGNARPQGSSLPPVTEQPCLQDMQPMPSRQPLPPMLQISSNQEYNNRNAQPNPPPPPPPKYVAVAEEMPSEPKKNIWSTILEQIRDPIFVIFLFFVLSLPVFHTFVGKYATWAFAIGGQLSWLGLGALSVLAGLLFGVFRGVCVLGGF